MSLAEQRSTGIAFVGTGFVADYYMTTLPNHSGLRLAGAFDRDSSALRRFAGFHHAAAYADLDSVLADPHVAIVVNLTTPHSHYEVSRRALEAGKHVYSEKPLAMTVADAEALVALAAARRLTLAAAPANALSAAHRTAAAALAAGAIGTPRLVYAEMEDGPVFREKWRQWRSASGAPWPGRHEFETGCTLEHAGYALAWLVSLFGPVSALSAFSTTAFADKGEAETASGPDFSVGSLVFGSGPVARLTCGLSAPKDRSLTILGDRGSIAVRDLWDHFSPVRIARGDAALRPVERIARRIERRIGRRLPFQPQPGRALAVEREPALRLPPFPSKIDFCAGIAAQARAIAEGGVPFFSGAVALHITELALMLSGAGHEAGVRKPRSSFNWPAAAPEPSR